MQSKKRKLVLFIAIALILPVGIWFGEDLKEMIISTTGIVVLMVIPLSSLVVIKGKWKKVTVCISAIALFLTGYQIGRITSRAAYHACLSDGEEIRISLSEYQSTHSRYPANLDELPSRPLGKRLLRGSILEYRRTATGYELSFGDWLVTHRATDKEPFLAAK